MRLSDFDVLTFDCYGTLIDWECGMIAALASLTDRAPRELSRDEILAAHGRHEARQELATPTKLYRDLLAVVYKRLAEEWGVAVGWDECVAYGRSIGDWPAFPDSPRALRYLGHHFQLAILSNVDNESFFATSKILGIELDAIYTAEDIGSYKPDDRNFEYLLFHLGERGVERGRILHVAESLFHDHVPAKRHGLATCWIHRRHGEGGFGATRAPDETPNYDFRFESLEALAEAHRAER